MLRFSLTKKPVETRFVFFRKKNKFETLCNALNFLKSKINWEAPAETKIKIHFLNFKKGTVTSQFAKTQPFISKLQNLEEITID